ncbi:hypothetical protein FA95DRAFT_1022115 [Auriscalpium vulgare]|uniref:Uncharacterized protein n=1 Tax=Auriscalpium vulgare TaxID=40419 RepID=A0ACB8RY74_9AGAM|nr:hypothetical protein FA95DRAFT_1022115 [Auriscalpium vulgare]
MSTPRWIPRTFSAQAKRDMCCKPPSEVLSLASGGSVLALHALVAGPVTVPHHQLVDALSIYCTSLRHSEPPDPRLLAAKDRRESTAVQRACYCFIGIGQVLEVLLDDAFLRHVAPAWNGMFKWMVYIFELYREERPQHVMISTVMTVVHKAATYPESRHMVFRTAGIVALTSAAWMNDVPTPDLPFPLSAANLADMLIDLPVSYIDEVLVAASGKASDVASRLVRGLRLATKTHMPCVLDIYVYLKLVRALGVPPRSPVRQALLDAGVLRAVTKATLKVSTLDPCRDSNVRCAIHLGFNLVVTFIEEGIAVDSIRQSVRDGILEAILNIGPHLNALPDEVTVPSRLLISRILLRYIGFRSITEAVCKSMRALRSSHPQVVLAAPRHLACWNALDTVASFCEYRKHLLEACASRSKAECNNCRVVGYKTLFKLCSACHFAAYCSVQCQKVAWNTTHKGECAEKRSRYLATMLSKSDASFQHAIAAMDAKRLVPRLRALATQHHPNIPLCNLTILLDYTQSWCPRYALSDVFAEDEGLREAECSDRWYQDNTMIRYIIRLGEYTEKTLLRIPSVWYEDDVQQNEDSFIREASVLSEDDVAQVASRFVCQGADGYEDSFVREVMDAVANRASWVFEVKRTHAIGPD